MQQRHQIVSMYQDIRNYIREVQKAIEPDYASLWTTYVIEPQWQSWAAGQFNEQRTRQALGSPLIDTEKLGAALQLMEQAGVETLVAAAYGRVLEALPAPEGAAVVCIMLDYNIAEELHGVVGSCVGDNMLLQINPFVNSWQEYIPWVIAHEHNHSIWGYDYFFIKGNRNVEFLTSLITEGMADSFAKSLCPELEPHWIRALEEKEAAAQWELMKQFLQQPDEPKLHIRFFFGDKENNTPPYTGYTIGYRLVQGYLRNNPETTFAELAQKSASEILLGSDYRID